MILTGSFKEMLDEGTAYPAAALIFENDGDMRLMMSDNLDDLDKEAVLLTTDFIAYALDHDEWLMQFINKVVSNSELPINEKKKPGVLLYDTLRSVVVAPLTK